MTGALLATSQSFTKEDTKSTNCRSARQGAISVGGGDAQSPAFAGSYNVVTDTGSATAT